MKVFKRKEDELGVFVNHLSVSPSDSMEVVVCNLRGIDISLDNRHGNRRKDSVGFLLYFKQSVPVWVRSI